MIWAEAGVHVWDMAHHDFTEERMAFQAAYYTDFYRMLEQSCADGIYWWWYPGGFRVNERSDYGIINPNGTDRPVTQVIKEHGPVFEQAPDPAPVDLWLTFDRDVHTNGLSGVYTALQEAFWRAIEAGNTPGLKTEGTGTDSTNCPPLAVGNSPWSGNNPPKYLDALFDCIEVQNDAGVWTRVLPGGTVPQNSGQSVKLRVSFTNLGEAALVPPAEAGATPGGVFITVSGRIKKTIPLPRRINRFEALQLEISLPDKKLTKVADIVISFEAKGRTPFGQKFAVKLQPVSLDAAVAAP